MIKLVLISCLFMFIVINSNISVLGHGSNDGYANLCYHNLTALNQYSKALENVSTKTIFISLCSNDLVTIEKDTFKDFEELEKISMGDNAHYQFPADGSPMLTSSSLTDMVCENCGIVEIFPRSLQGLPHLEFLELPSNSISHISNRAFRNNRHLKNINLSSNLLRVIPFTLLIGLRELESVDLSFNSELVPSERKPFLINNALEILKCNGCGITFINKYTFAKLPNIKELHLRGNPVFQGQQSAALSQAINLLMLHANSKLRSTVGVQSNDENLEISNMLDSDDDNLQAATGKPTPLVIQYKS